MEILPLEDRPHEVEVGEVGEAVHRVVEEARPRSKIIQTAEHRAVLREAIEASRSEIIIVSPWLTTAAVDGELTSWLDRALQRHGNLRVVIGYGIEPDRGKNDRKAMDQRDTLRRLHQLGNRYRGRLRTVEVGNTHEKLVITDERFAIVTRFNWLSFNPRPDKGMRRETGCGVARRRTRGGRAASRIPHGRARSKVTRGLAGWRCQRREDLINFFAAPMDTSGDRFPESRTRAAREPAHVEPCSSPGRGVPGHRQRTGRPGKAPTQGHTAAPQRAPADALGHALLRLRHLRPHCPAQPLDALRHSGDYARQSPLTRRRAPWRERRDTRPRCDGDGQLNRVACSVV